MKKRRLLIVIGSLCLTLVLVALLLPACAEEAAPAAPEEKEVEVLQWRCASSQTGEIFNEYSRLWSGMVGDYSDGRIKVEHYPNAMLGSLSETFIAVQEGSLEAGVVHPYTDLVPGGLVNDMPWMVGNYEESALVYGHGGIIFNTMSDAWGDVGCHLVLITGQGAYGIANKVRPLKTPDDFEHWKFRVSGAAAYVKAMENMSEGTGMTLETLPWADLYNALERGVIDGMWDTWLLIVEERHMEVVKYWTPLNFGWDTSTLVMPKDLWDGLPKDLKDAVSKAGLASEYYAYEYASRADIVAKEQLAELSDVEVYYLTPEEMEAFREKANMPAIWDELCTPYLDKRYPGQNMTKKILDELAEARALVAGK